LQTIALFLGLINNLSHFLILRESIIITAVKSKIGMNYYHASLPYKQASTEIVILVVIDNGKALQ
jgi:hypothetical protein